MSEQPSPSTPETQKPRLKGAPEGLQLDTLDDLVGYKSEISSEYERLDDKTEDFESFKARRLEELLAENGIRSSEDDMQAQEDYNFAKGVYKEVLDMNTRQWLGLPEGQDRNRREVVAGAVREWYSSRVAAEEQARRDAVDQAHDTYEDAAEAERKREEQRAAVETQDEAIEYMDGLTSKYATLVAERSKRMIEGAKTRQDIEATQAELSDMLSAIATEMMIELEKEGKPWEEVTGEIDQFIGDQTDEVLGRMEQHRLEEYNNARPLMKKFYDTWAQWSEKEGLITAGKVKKALVFAVPGAAAGVALMPVAGAIGIGAGVAGLALMGGRSIARRLAGGKLDSAANAANIAGEQKTDIKSRITADREQNDHKLSTDEILAVISERSEAYRKRNRNRTIGGIAIAMTAGLVSGTAANALDGKLENFWSGKLGKWVRDFRANKPSVDVDGPDMTAPGLTDRDGDGIPDIFDGYPDGSDHQPGGPDGAEGNPGVSSRDELFNGRFGTRELSVDGREALAEQLNGYTVKPGDNVWNLSEQFLHEQGIKNPTVYEIDATKDTLLGELRATGSADSRGWLSVGDKIRIK